MNRSRLMLWSLFGISMVLLFTLLIFNLELNYVLNYNYDYYASGPPPSPLFYNFFSLMWGWTSIGLYTRDALFVLLFFPFLISFFYLRRSELRTSTPVFLTLTLASFVIAFHSTLIWYYVRYDRTLYVVNLQAHSMSWFTNQDLMLLSVPSTIILALTSIRLHKSSVQMRQKISMSSH